MIFLIFFFVARQALPIFLGQMNSSLMQEVIPVEQMDKIPPARLREYLGLTPKQFAAMDADTRRALGRAPWEGEFDPLQGIILHEQMSELFSAAERRVAR